MNYNVYIELEHKLNTKTEQDLLSKYAVNAQLINKFDTVYGYVISGFYTDITKYLAELSDLEPDAKEISEIMFIGYYL